MLRIDSVESGNHYAVLRLEGRVAGPWVAELREVCERLLNAGRPVELDMAEVTFVDQAAATLLQGLKSRGIQLIACSPFVEQQLTT
jgi:anti-anti-sigma regulatory factor